MYQNRSRRIGRRHKLSLMVFVFALHATLGFAQGSFEGPPIEYTKTPVNDPTHQLIDRIQQGKQSLEYDGRHGWLPSLLKALEISKESQVLVFSKTSMQQRLISPKQPRALYFNDHTSVGWVQQDGLIEISSVDPQQGVIFYTLNNRQQTRPRFQRHHGTCLFCHMGTETRWVPGLFVRSVFPDRNGRPFRKAGKYTTTQNSPLAERWGGWYVTGEPSKQKHMGNAVLKSTADAKANLVSPGNLLELNTLIDVSPYLTSSSDIVALMVFEHQCQMQNLIIRANYEARKAIWYDEQQNREQNRPAGYRSEEAKQRISRAVDELLRYLLFAEEFRLTGPIKSSGKFTQAFTVQRTMDTHGRSLRDFDLKKRLFKYPCSYLIYTDSFDALPESIKDVLYPRLLAVLTQQDQSKEFAHLSKSDRKAILEILLSTKKTLPAEWYAQKKSLSHE